MQDRTARRIGLKIDTFSSILNSIKELSVSKTKKVGCIAVKKDFSKIASFGYNGSFGGDSTKESTGCEEDSLEPGYSGFIHAEINMIAKFKEHDPENYIVLLTLSPCKMCTKVLINAGFKYVYFIEEYRETGHLNFFDIRSIKYGDVEKLKEDYLTIRSE
tara:strand:- start:107745 stop:108224 length:480 start_codon:yes stop_codon:yes gene_type:complete